jgi:hypothetical protein
MFLSDMTVMDVQIYMATRRGELLHVSCPLDSRRKPPLIISFESIFFGWINFFFIFYFIIILL